MRHRLLLTAALVVFALGTVAVAVGLGGDQGRPDPASSAPPAAVPASSGQASSPPPAPSATPSPPEAPLDPLVDRREVGRPWGSVSGLTMFRGNPTRTWYGTGPVPAAPAVRWRYPDRAMCTNEQQRDGTVKRWCGSGWTGQPVVWEREDGVTEVIVGTYDGAVHFIDAATGRDTRPPFQTGDIIKGSVTLDPDGYPLLYTGSRDNRLRALALDRDRPVELWALEAHPQRVWNNDWDGNPAIVDGLLLEGGEDSWFYAVELNRAYGPDGLVTLAPEVILETPGWTDELLAQLPDRNVSLESSVAVFEGRAYIANSGGRVFGVDLRELRATGEAPVVFEYWMGDDVDATVVIDGEGMLYVAAELERFLPRAREVGQLVKLDPSRPDDPLVWSVEVPPREDIPNDDGGIWATPALHAGLVYVTTHPGDLLVVDGSGEVIWRERIGHHEWSSPAIVDDTLIVGACEETGVRAWSLADPRAPEPLWHVPTGGCVESTPAVWDGGIYVGSRDGYVYGIG